jgi:hypothetical protein
MVSVRCIRIGAWVATFAAVVGITVFGARIGTYGVPLEVTDTHNPSVPASRVTRVRMQHATTALPVSTRNVIPNTASTGCARASDHTVHVALIAHGWAAKGYHDASSIKGPGVSLRVAVKGILRATTLSPLVLHFVVGEPDATDVRRLMAVLSDAIARRTCPVATSVTLLNTSQVDQWMAYIGHIATHRTGHAGNVKFFYPLLFPHVEKMLMLDTDVLVAADLTHLWSHFDATFATRPSQLFSFVSQWPRYDAVKDNQFNAGVGLLHLGRMRAANWLDLSRRAIAAWTAARMHPPCCAHGDQSVFHMIRWYRQETMPADALLPRMWNVNKCHGYQGLKSTTEQRAALQRARQRSSVVQPVSVGIVHLGCCKLCTPKKIGPVWADLFRDIDAWPEVSLPPAA